MSVLLMTQAWEVKLANASRKLVLVKLADNANDEGICWPSYAYLADQCEISERTVIRHVKDLVNSGFIEKKTRYGGALFNKTNLYKLTLSKGDISHLKTGETALENDVYALENRGDNLSCGEVVEVTMEVSRGDNEGKFGVTEKVIRGDTESPRTIIEPPLEPSIEPSCPKTFKKPTYIREVFNSYPAHRRGGTDSQLWKLWKQEKLGERDAVKMMNWLFAASQSFPSQWGTDANGQYVQGLTKFVRERLWLSPIPLAEPKQFQQRNVHPANFHSGDTSWADDLGEL